MNFIKNSDRPVLKEALFNNKTNGMVRIGKKQ